MSDRSEDRELQARASVYPLKVLVWGPGAPGATASAQRRKGYEKRVQIKEEIKKHLPNAAVYFSEDPQMRKMGFSGMTQMQREAENAVWAHLVIALNISQGVHTELAYIVPHYPSLRDRIYVLMPKRYVNSSGLARRILDDLNPQQIVGYTPQEFAKCLLATKIAVDIALSTAVTRFIKGI